MIESYLTSMGQVVDGPQVVDGNNFDVCVR